MKKLFNLILIFIFMLTINVNAEDTCFIKVGGVCKLTELKDYVYNETTGSITYDNTNKSLTLDNYEGNEILLKGFDTTVSIIFEGNNIITSSTPNPKKTGFQLYDNHSFEITGKKNSTVTFNNVIMAFSSNNIHDVYRDLTIYAYDTNSIFYNYRGLIEIYDCVVTHNNGYNTVNTSMSINTIIDNLTLNSDNVNNPIYVNYGTIILKNSNITANNLGTMIDVYGDDANLNSSFIITNNTIKATNMKNSGIVFHNINNFEFKKNIIELKGTDNILTNGIDIGGCNLSNNINAYIENNNIKINQFSKAIYLYGHDTNYKANIYFNNNKLETSKTTNSPLGGSYLNIYANNNEVVSRESGYISWFSDAETISIIGGSYYLEGENSFRFKNANVTIEDVDYEFVGNNSADSLGIFFENNNGNEYNTIIKNSDIKISNCTNGIKTNNNLTLENNNIDIKDCTVGLLFNGSKLNINNSNVKISNPNKEKISFGMQLSRSDGLEININKSNLLIDILTKNTSPDLEIGLLIQHDMGDALLNIKDSEVTINNLYDGENTTVSGIKKNGLYLYGTKVTVNNSFMIINTDNIFGSAYYNDRAVTGDKFTITPSNYKIKTDAILYDYNNTQILLNNNDLTKEDLVKSDMMGYSNPTLLIDLDSYTYDIIDGNKQEIIKNDNKEYSFKIDGNHLLLSRVVYNDMELIRDIDYIVAKGSTIITFSETGLNKIKDSTNGKHEIKVTYNTGEEVDVEFTLADEINPKTGDNVAIYILLAIFSFDMMTRLIKRTREDLN